MGSIAGDRHSSLATTSTHPHLPLIPHLRLGLGPTWTRTTETTEYDHNHSQLSKVGEALLFTFLALNAPFSSVTIRYLVV